MLLSFWQNWWSENMSMLAGRLVQYQFKTGQTCQKFADCLMGSESDFQCFWYCKGFDFICSHLIALRSRSFWVQTIPVHFLISFFASCWLWNYFSNMLNILLKFFVFFLDLYRARFSSHTVQNAVNFLLEFCLFNWSATKSSPESVVSRHLCFFRGLKLPMQILLITFWYPPPFSAPGDLTELFVTNFCVWHLRPMFLWNCLSLFPNLALFWAIFSIHLHYGCSYKLLIFRSSAVESLVFSFQLITTLPVVLVSVYL